MAVQTVPSVPTRRKFTTAEYYQMAEAGILRPDERVELIDGEIWTMTPIGVRHNAGVLRVSDLFYSRLGRVVQMDVQGPVRLAPSGEPEPDVMVLRRRADYYASGLPTSEDVFLLAEISDTTLDFDRDVKVPSYARNGIREVWIVNFVDDVVEVYREPTPNGYLVSEIRRRGEVLAPRAFPDCQLAVADILG
jgi:Uma2 family endonuclease